MKNKKVEITFGQMSEQRMGSAYACDIYLNMEHLDTEGTEGVSNLLLYQRSTGSALLQNDESIVYFVIWMDTEEGYLMQQLAAYSLLKGEIDIFETLYNVLNLESIDGHSIKAIENPYTKPKPIVIDIEKEKISQTIQWTNVESEAILSERQKYLASLKP